MHFSPDDIANRSFTVTHRGYDRSEVHAFLVQVARQIRVSAKGDGAIDLRSADAAAEVIAAAEREAEAIVGDAMKTRAEADTYAASIRLQADGVAPAPRSVPRPVSSIEPQPLVPAPPSPLSDQRYAELLDAERDIVRRLESTSQDLQQSYGSGTATSDRAPSDAEAPASPPAPAPPPAPASPRPPATQATTEAPKLTPPEATQKSPPAPPPTPEPPVATKPTAEAGIEVDDELEVVKKASDLLDGVLDDVMGSLRSGDA